ncbi:DNA-binding response regulator [Bifidobacterium goeldii]
MIARMDARFEVIWTSELGAVAIRRCLSTAKRPDVLVTDMSMRDVPGTEVCRAIRVKTPKVGVVGVTSYAVTSFCAEAARCGMQALIAKTDLNGMATAIRNAARGMATNACGRSDRLDDGGEVGGTGIVGDGVGRTGAAGAAFAGATADVRFLDAASAHMLLEDGSYERRGALSAKERDTLRLYAEGLATKEIAAAYGVSEATVATFERRALAKLGARSRAHAISICVRRHEF